MFVCVCVFGVDDAVCAHQCEDEGQGAGGEGEKFNSATRVLCGCVCVRACVSVCALCTLYVTECVLRMQEATALLFVQYAPL